MTRVIAIAWPAQRRLHQRWQHVRVQRGKPTGVVTVACACELASFFWEAATPYQFIGGRRSSAGDCDGLVAA